MGESLGELEQLVLLALLRVDPDEAFGVGIEREIASETGRSVTLGAIYTALLRLEAKGMVSWSTSDPTPQRGGRRRKLYRVLPAGRRALARAMTAIRRLSHGLGSSLEVR
jgi:DNA-binding PadR family transcriptional regulator